MVVGMDDSNVLLQNMDRLTVLESRLDTEFNPSECQVSKVSTSRKAVNFSHKPHGQVLEVVSRARTLRVDISSGLSCNSHVDRIIAKANSTCTRLCQKKQKLKTVKSENLSVTRLFARSWSTGPPSGILTPNERYSSLKRFNAVLHDGPPIIMIIGPM